MDAIGLVIQAVSGMIGGNAVGSIDKDFNLGIGVNSMLGIGGGVLSGQLLNQLGVGTGPLDVLTLLSQVGSGALGGALIAFLAGALRVLIK